jgi:hypothetical protein
MFHLEPSPRSIAEIKNKEMKKQVRGENIPRIQSLVLAKLKF